jgi:PAS domain S-box-containing protein
MRSVNDSSGRSHALAVALESFSPDAQTNFRDLLGKVNLIAVTIDRDAKITYCNEFFLKLTGWSFPEIEGRNWHELFVPPSIEDLRPLFADIFKGLPETWHHENDIFTRTGERRTIRWNNILLKDSLGRAVAAGSIGEDITDRKKLERALADCHDRERCSLEKEMHDGLGQELAGIALLARSLATVADRSQRDLSEDLQRLSIIASQAIESCRKIARGFAPYSELHGGLVHAIRLLVEVPENWSGPRLEFAVSQTAPVTLSAEGCDHVYHLVQEVLTHGISSSGAASIRVTLRIRPTWLSATISHDGAAPPPVTDLMQHRAALVQGSLRLEPLESRGARLILCCRQP